MGLIEKSSVTAFLEDYYEKHPLDNSFEGVLARKSGLTKEKVIATIDTINYLTFIVDYEPDGYYPLNYQKPEAEKIQIARCAAAMIEDRDFVYLDAGTTTGYMIEFLARTKASFVTNAVAHAQKLAAQGNRVFLVGGELKSSTEAVIGAQAMETLERYHFTKGFFGTNGISRNEGFTTPDAGEAQVKRTAMRQCRIRYVLADSTKFGNISAVTFASFDAGIILTEKIVEGYQAGEKLILCQQEPG